MWRRRRLWLEDTKLERNEELKHPCCHEWEPAGARPPRFHCGNHEIIFLLAGKSLSFTKTGGIWWVKWRSAQICHPTLLTFPGVKCETGMSRRAVSLVGVIWQSRFQKLHKELILLTVWARCPVLEIPIEASFINAMKSPTVTWQECGNEREFWRKMRLHNGHKTDQSFWHPGFVFILKSKDRFPPLTCHYGNNKSIKIPLMVMTSCAHR